MKKSIKALLLGIFASTFLFGAVACKDDEQTTDARDLYEIAKDGGFTGTYEEWIQSLTNAGAQGAQGEQGAQGAQGDDGLSAYELYCKYHPVYQGTEEEWVTALGDGSLMQSYTQEYNIIFTLATVPPVLASLDAISNGAETYACIERGKTYNGIDGLENFHNVGFNINSNQSTGFTNAQMDTLVDKVKELNVFGNENFNIYISDATGMSGFALAANAQLQTSQYEITLLEDGTGAYDYFEQYYLRNKTVSETVDEPYDTFVARVEQTKSQVADILSRTDNKYTDYGYDLDKAITLATFPNVTFWYQDLDKMEAMLKATDDGTVHSKLLSVFKVDGYNDDVSYTVNLRDGNIAETVAELSETQKEDYLKLMYGSAYEGTYTALTRTTIADNTPVPTEKLIFIGSRIHEYPDIASDAQYGIGGLTEGEVPATYAQLDAKYKADMLFGNEDDYNVLISVLNNYDYGTATADTINAVKRACFNYYIDYMYTFKFTYALYGQDYDIILKGHPRQVLGEPQDWKNYSIDNYNFDVLMNAVAEAFHESDSVGKYIGTVPFGTSAENLAYLGIDIAICGLPSSTYTGYDTAVDVKFVLSTTNGNVTTDNNLVGRYNDGTLKDGDKITTFYNVGYFFKTLKAYYTEQSDTVNAGLYGDLFDAWLRSVNNLESSADVTGYDVDAQGFLIVPDAN